MPDVAALAEDIPFVWNGETYLSGGTSFAAPEWAGVISLVTDYRLNNVCVVFLNTPFFFFFFFFFN